MAQRLLVAWCKANDMFYDSQPSFSLISACELPGCNIVPWVEKKKGFKKKVNFDQGQLGNFLEE